MRIYAFFISINLGMTWEVCQGEEPGAAREPIAAQSSYPASMTLASPTKENRPLQPAEGFTGGTYEAGFSLSGAFGMRMFGGRELHNLAFASLHYGWVLSDVVAKGQWYQGNWELMGEAFGGAHYNGRIGYVTGIGPGLRYNFITGTAFVPFMHAGAGGSLSNIRRPDLGSTFQFNLQAGPGVHYFWRENTALTLQYRFFHMSNAGMVKPNQGLNTHAVFIGASWFYGPR